MIHNTAIIGKDVKIDKDVYIGPFVVIEGDVTIGSGTKIYPSSYISGNTIIGNDNIIHSFCSIGSIPQDLKYHGEQSFLKIGNSNIFREHCTVNTGTENGGSNTIIGSNSLFMTGSHIAHDCIVGNNVIMANQATLGGHVNIEDNAVIGGLSAIHQFCRIGTLSMIGGMSAVEHDVVPYGLITGNRAHLLGLNIVGLRRAKYSNEIIKDFKNTFEKIFNSNEIKTEAILNNDTTNVLTKNLIDFVKSDSSRGLCSFK